MISLKAHNILDYVFGALLIGAPFVFGFSGVDSARAAFLILGLCQIGYSLLTRYRYSLVHLIPLGMHMALDSVVGFIVMIAPWLFGYQDILSGAQVFIHLVLGLATWALVALTETTTSSRQEEDEGQSFQEVA